jgi:methyl-accepting chemotaxis protein
MERTAAQSAFEAEVATYRETMDSLHRSAEGHSASVESLDAAMVELRDSVAAMTDAVDEYGHAIGEFETAVISLQEHTSGDKPETARDASTTVPVAGD